MKKDIQKEYLCVNIFYIVIHTFRFYTCKTFKTAHLVDCLNNIRLFEKKDYTNRRVIWCTNPNR